MKLTNFIRLKTTDRPARITIYVVALTSALLATGTAIAGKHKFGVIERAFELAQVTLHVNKNGVGTAEILPCPTCQPVTYRITPQTRAYRDEKEVPITPKLNLQGLRVHVYYLNNTKNITRMFWSTQHQEP
jgi:hypothetical protein